MSAAPRIPESALAYVPAVAERRLSAATLVAPDAGWPPADKGLGQKVLALVNTHRAQLGLQAIAPIGSLTAAAEWKARHMAQYAYMAHDDPAPPIQRPWYERLADNGYGSQFASENIAFGYPTAETVLAGWLASPGHRSNLEGPAWTASGVGAALNRGGTVYWAQCFGVGADPAPPTPDPAPNPTSSHQIDMWSAQVLPDLAATTQTYRNWRKTNKPEAKAFDAFLADGGSPPAMASAWGRFLVGTTRIVRGQE